MPTTTPRPPALTLIGRRASLWLFWSAQAALLAVWIGESALGVIAPNYRIAYPALMLCFFGAALLAWRRPSKLLLAQRLAVLALQFHLVQTAWSALLHAPGAAEIYAVGTLGPWAVVAQLFVFASWRPALALGLSLLTGLLGLAPLLWPHDAAIDAQLTPLLPNGALAQGIAAVGCSGWRARSNGWSSRRTRTPAAC